MFTRRQFAKSLGVFSAASFMGGTIPDPRQVQASSTDRLIRLDANESPEGPPASAVDAIVRGAPAAARYHFEEFATFTDQISRSEGLSSEQVLIGIGSSDLINAAICAFTSATIPLITAVPTYEIPIQFARSLGHRVLTEPLSSEWDPPLQKLVEDAEKAKGGLIYLCNPNNPTSLLTSFSDIEWLASNLPPNTVLLIDEAYIHFVERMTAHTAIRHVLRDRNVIVTRTFSKIYGLAGARAGFGCARPEIIERLRLFQGNVMPVLAIRAASAALAENATLIPARRQRVLRARQDLCIWMRREQIGYVEPQANFVMIEINKDAEEFGQSMFRRGVAVGRPFPPLRRMLRVTIGTDQEMAKFRDVFLQVYRS